MVAAPLTLMLVAVGYALLGSARARSVPLTVAALGFAYAVVAGGLYLLPRPVALPLGSALAAHWTVLPVVLLAVSCTAMVGARRLERQHEEGMPRQRHLRTAVFAYLAMAILSAIWLFVTALAHVYVANAI